MRHLCVNGSFCVLVCVLVCSAIVTAVGHDATHIAENLARWDANIAERNLAEREVYADEQQAAAKTKQRFKL